MAEKRFDVTALGEAREAMTDLCQYVDVCSDTHGRTGLAMGTKDGHGTQCRRGLSPQKKEFA